MALTDIEAHDEVEDRSPITAELLPNCKVPQLLAPCVVAKSCGTDKRKRVAKSFMDNLHWSRIIAGVGINLFRAALICGVFAFAKWFVTSFRYSFNRKWVARSAFYLGAMLLGFYAADFNLPSCDDEQYDCPSVWEVRGAARENAVEVALITFLAAIAGIERSFWIANHHSRSDDKNL
jgi:hypothetical protein